MHWSEIALLVVLAIASLGFLLWRAANRIDRLHWKVVSHRIALDNQLLRRAGASVDLAASGLIDPTSAVILAQTGYQILDNSTAPLEPAAAMRIAGLGLERERDESDLTATLRQVIPDAEAVSAIICDPIGNQLLTTLAGAWYRATLARRFHNQAVADARNSRKHWWVRTFHLAGHAPLPETVELDDAILPELSTLATARPIDK